VSEEVRESVGRVYPLPLSAEQAQSLAGAPRSAPDARRGRPRSAGEDLVAPVRLITDRNGKGWRSYAALACW